MKPGHMPFLSWVKYTQKLNTQKKFCAAYKITAYTGQFCISFKHEMPRRNQLMFHFMNGL